MRPNDSCAVTAARHMKRETGLVLPPSRFWPVCVHTMTWQFRQQAPQGHGAQFPCSFYYSAPRVKRVGPISPSREVNLLPGCPRHKPARGGRF